MATVNVTKTEGEGRTTRYTWTMGAGDDGEPIKLPGAADRTLQAFGSFFGTSVGGQISLEPDGAAPSNWFEATDQSTSDIAITSADGVFVTEMGTWFRPKTTGGDSGGTTALTVILLARSTMR